MHNLFYSSCPVVRRSVETFVERLLVGGERQTFHFSREIIWLQESEAVVRLVHGGKEITHGSTHTDFYGYLSSAKLLVEEAARECVAYGVTAASTLEIEIVSRVFQRPVIETPETRKHNATKPANIKSQWSYVPDGFRKDVLVDGETFSRSFARVELAEEVVWSSKRSEEENQVSLDAFRAKWVVQADQPAPVEAH